MKGRETHKQPPSADLLVCFPSRSHLSLMPKPICSPGRPDQPKTRRNSRHHHRKPSAFASPMVLAKNKQINQDNSEPTSPKVTCAGQVKIRPKPGQCKSWQSVMEEIERIHVNRHNKKKPSWIDSLGFKKEVVQFLTCLRNIRFDFQCFGSFPAPVISSDSEEDDDDEELEEEEETESSKDSKAVFSKWYMVLQENNSNTESCSDKKTEKRNSSCDFDKENREFEPAVPPPNALLLMRCRSAPAKSRFEEKTEEEEARERTKRDLRSLMEEEAKLNKKYAVKTYEESHDYYKLSADIAKETWVVDGMKDLLYRSRSSKR